MFLVQISKEGFFCKFAAKTAKTAIAEASKPIIQGKMPGFPKGRGGQAF
jgi:hypothetical protein